MQSEGMKIEEGFCRDGLEHLVGSKHGCFTREGSNHACQPCHRTEKHAVVSATEFPWLNAGGRESVDVMVRAVGDIGDGDRSRRHGRYQEQGKSARSGQVIFRQVPRR